MDKKYICMDVGGTKILSSIFVGDEIIAKLKKKTKAYEGFEKLEDKIFCVVEEIIENSGVKKEEIGAISIGAAGIINENTGEIIYAPNLPWRNYNIKKAIEDKFNIPFFIGNDVNVGILGEWKYGAAKGEKNVVGVFVGTGIGGGLIINNALYTGSNHAAGEIGHISVNTEGPLCNCGQRGCVEAYAGKSAMLKSIKSEIDRGTPTLLKELLNEDYNVLKSKVLKRAIDQNDAVAIEILDRAVYYLSAGVGSLLNILNPETVIIGGGVVDSLKKNIMPLLKDYLKKFTMPDILKGTELKTAELGDDAILYGARAFIDLKKGDSL